ncbi:MFS transporter [Pseudonocardia sp. CA-107938]|uniref:MFS transporter n=1 Tax=Pseudonocardia sp. CA-107938 TaxID=3240021 RepID=UPI003D90361A
MTTSSADPTGGRRRLGALGRRLVVDTRPLAVPAFRRQLLGQGTAYTGSMITNVAVAVEVYDLSRSTLAVGMVGLAGLLPLLLFGIYGGSIADAVDRRTLYLIASVVGWLVTLGLLARTMLGVGGVPTILGLVALQAAAFALSTAVRGAIVPRLVDEHLVASANTLVFTMTNIGIVVGPLVAGLLVVGGHFAEAYAVDAVLFTGALYAAVRLPRLPPLGETRRAGLRAIRDGLAYVRLRPVLIMSFVVDLVAMTLAMPKALFPAVADERWGGQVGPLYAAIAIGAIGAGMASGWVGRVVRQGRALTLAVVVWGLAIGLAGLAGPLWVAVALLALAGAADFVSGVYRLTILQSHGSDEFRGRLQGILVVVSAGGPRLGDLRAGAAAEFTGTLLSWVGGGLLCAVLIALAGRLVRPFWDYRAPVSAAAGSDRSASRPR